MRAASRIRAALVFGGMGELVQSGYPHARRGGRVVDRARLESGSTFTGTGSSNLPLSASYQISLLFPATIGIATTCGVRKWKFSANDIRNSLPSKSPFPKPAEEDRAATSA